MDQITQAAFGGYAAYGTLKAKYASKTTETKTFDETAALKDTPSAQSKKGTILSDYNAKHPENKSVMDRWMNTGYEVLKARGLSEVDTSDMSLSEYKEYIGDIISSIPFDATRPYDEETVMITDEGWEAMRSDPDYEAWVIGHIKENRDVKNPFFGMEGKTGGTFAIQKFGASPEERQGYGWSKIYGGTAAGARAMYNSASAGGFVTNKAPLADTTPPADYDLWEERRKSRRERQKELMEEEIESMLSYKHSMEEMWQQRIMQTQSLQKSYKLNG